MSDTTSVRAQLRQLRWTIAEWKKRHPPTISDDDTNETMEALDDLAEGALDAVGDAAALLFE